MPDFIAVDGEADYNGTYLLLRDSTGRELYRPEGISTHEAFEWLLRLQGHNRVVVCFGLNYDVNQWIKDFSRGELKHLAEHGKSIHRLRYKVEWWPTKSFTITDGKTGRRVKISEVFGFFQTSFLKALETWGLPSPRIVEDMKKRRGTFGRAEIKRVSDYCLTECRLLVQLMNRLYEACDGADCVPKSWVGAGSIASALLTKYGVKDHLVHDMDLAPREIVETAILGAYYGGRVELLAQGVCPVVHTRDIRSAYPFAAVSLPSLTDASVRPVRRYDPTINAIWRVQWDIRCAGVSPARNRMARLCPFPVRRPDHSIAYPLAGEGFYHGVEVAGAKALYGDAITVMEGVELAPACGESRPFQFIPELFRHRARLKQQGNPAEKAIKLGLNSVYGKLAQGYGHRPFQSYWWAGYITAATRARMLQLAAKSRGVIMVSTDGLFATNPGTRGSAKPVLGSWEPDTVKNLFAAQPGVYSGIRQSGTPMVKSRGFFASEVDYGELQRLWETHGPDAVYHYTSRRFIGLRVALHRKDPSVWRQWVEENRTINLHPERKYIGDRRHDGMLQLDPLNGPLESLPYTPKESLYDDPTDEQLENMVADDQPHMEVIEG